MNGLLSILIGALGLPQGIARAGECPPGTQRVFVITGSPGAVITANVAAAAPEEAPPARAGWVGGVALAVVVAALILGGGALFVRRRKSAASS